MPLIPGVCSAKYYPLEITFSHVFYNYTDFHVNVILPTAVFNMRLFFRKICFLLTLSDKKAIACLPVIHRRIKHENDVHQE